MIEIIINREKLVLSDNFTIRLSFKFPLPYMNNIPAISSYWTTVPAVSENNKIFKNANFIYGIDNILIYDCILEIAQNQYKGKLFLQNAKTREYKFFVTINNVITEFASKKIREVANHTHFLGNDENEIIAEARRLSTESYPTENYAFPMIANDVFFADTNPNFKGIINNFFIPNNAPGEYFKNIFNGTDVLNYNALVAMPYLLFTLQNIFEQIRYSITGSILNNPDFQKLIIYNNYANQRITAYDYVNVKRDAEMILGDMLPAFPTFTQIVSDDYNRWSGAYTCRSAGTYRVFISFEINQDYISPNQDFILRLYEQGTANFVHVQGLAFTNNEAYIELSNDVDLQAKTYQVSIVWDNNIVSAEPTYIYNINFYMYPASEYFRDRFAKEIYLKNHLPDLTVTDFLNEITKKFSLAAFFDTANMKVELEEWNNILSNTNYLDLTDNYIKNSEIIYFDNKSFSLTTEWENDELAQNNFKDISGYENIRYQFTTPLPAPNKANEILYLVPAKVVYISTVSGTTLNWTWLTDDFQDIIIENKDTENIEIKLSTLVARDITTPDTYSGILPHIKQTGTTSETGENNPGFKILNYHGFYDAYSDYPYAANCNYDRFGNKISGINLQMQGEEGLYNRFHKKLYEYLSSRNLVEMQFKIDASLIHKIAAIFKAGNKTRKIKVGARIYIPESVDITILKNKVSTCKMKLR